MNRRTGTWIILALGGITLLALWSLVRDTVFFSGDGGMKFILVQHFARGDFAPVVVTQAASWVNALWHEGFFPFDPPFGYQQSQGMYVAYPLYFPLLASPFHALLGYRGLYVVPMMAVVGTWLVVLRSLRLAGVTRWSEWFALAALVFSTSLSLYGAMFWEHTLSVFFVAFTLPYFVRALDGTIRWPVALMLGALSALSVFFRAETGALLLIVGAAGLWINGKARWQSSLAYGVGLALGVGAFILANQVAYGIPTGVHSLQLLERDLFSAKRVRDMFSDVSDMLPRLLRTTPLIVSGIVALPIAWLAARGKPAVRRMLGWSAAITLAVFVLTPLLLPSDGHKQWGARFYLILLPWVALTLALIAEGLQPPAETRAAGAAATAPDANLSKGWRYFAAGVLGIGFAAGLLYNGFAGVRALRADYDERVLPALEAVRAEDSRSIVVTHQWIAQELASLYFDRDFFWLREDDDLPRLFEGLRAQGVEELLYLTYAPGSSRHRPLDSDVELRESHAEYLGEYGSYWLYRVQL